jgi:isopentenyl-diphosphate delta-isomerase
MTATEYVILVDDDDKEIGIAPKLYAHEAALLHRAFSVFVYRNMIVNGNSQIEWLLQQRAHEKYHSPGLWTNTCCSHPKPKESVLAAAERRLQEEMGLSLSLAPCGQFKYKATFENGLVEHEIDHVFVGRAEPLTSIQANPSEVASYRWVETALLAKELKECPKLFTPWFQAAWEMAYCHLSFK